MLLVASISGFLGTIWWTALVAVVSAGAGVYFSSYVKSLLNRR